MPQSTTQSPPRIAAVASPPAYAVVRYGMTATQYFALPDDDPNRYELLDGELAVVPAPENDHQDTLLELTTALASHLKSANLGGKLRFAPSDFKLSEKTVLQPDLMYYPPGHPDLPRTGKYTAHPPALVVEIVSPSSRARDMRAKLNAYRETGVPHYWLGDPKRRTVEAFSLEDGEYVQAGTTTTTKSGPTFSAPPFPNLALPLTQLFEDRV